MSNYTPYYEGGWKNEEEMTTTPICAEALNHMEEGISAAYDTDIGLYPTETASGDVAVIHDGAESIPVRDLSVAIEPVQSLNGYERPWAGGAGKNLLPIDRYIVEANGITFTKNADGSITANGTATATAQIRYRGAFLPAGNYKFNGCPAGGNSETYHVYAWDYTTGARPKKWDGTTGSANDVGTGFQEIKVEEGHEIAINCRVLQGVKVTNIVFKPMIVKASETDATYEPYSNICPISGWDAVRVARTSRNLLPKEYTETVFSRNGLTFTVNADGSLTANGTATAPTYFNYSGWEYDTLPFMHRPGLRLRLSGSYPGVMTRLQTRPSGSSTTTTIATDTGAGAEFTVPDDVRAYALFINVTTGQTLTNATFYPVISMADEGQPIWSPSEAEVTDITLPSTVYGGTLDVTTGILTVDRGFVTWNGTEDWVLAGGKKARCNIYALQNLIKRPASASEVLEGLQASYLTAKTDNATYQGTVGISCQTNGVVGITLTGEATTVDAVKAYLAEHPLQVVYPLATPITYTLTPTEIKTLLGENRIYADAGDVEVQYRVDFNEAGLMYVPKAPTADGSYRLTADVTGGTPTYRWEAAE